MLEKQSNQASGIGRRSKRTRGKVCIRLSIFLISLIFSMPSVSRGGILICDPPPRLTVTKSGSGTGTVTSAPGGIDCGVDCQEGYPINCINVVVTLTATPDAGSVFVGWNGDPDCSEGVVTMEADKTCIALFRLLSSDWRIFPIDQVRGSYSSIAVDTKDKVHVAYEAHHADGTGGDLKYATKTNLTGPWVTTTVDSMGGVGISSSIGLDSKGKVHISYYDWLNLDLKYATNAGGSWATTTVDSAGNVGATTAIAVDKDNWAHIVYDDSTSGINLKYATNATGSWVTSTIDNSGGVCPGGLTMDIAADSLGNLHIGYCHSGGLKYATNATGSWVTTTVDPNGGLDVSIAVDKNNTPHMSYYQINNIPSPGFGDLKYATNPTGSWETTTLDSTGDTGGRTSIGLDSNGNVHISYYDFTNQDIRYATNASGAWVMETVDSGYVGEFTATSLALDSYGKVHISYYTGADVANMVGYGPLYTTNAPVLSVTPVDGFSSSGNQGGPFTPSSKAYTLQNTSGSSINWTGSKLQTWTTLSSAGGKLAAGARTTVTVSINSGANSLTPGFYSDTVSFTNTTNGSGTTTRPVNLTVNPSSITVTTLNGGETWAAGTTHAISWSYTGNPGASVKIELLKGGVLNRTIISSRSIGSGGSGSYNWPIPATQAGGSDYQVKVTSTTNSAYTDTSDANFTIIGPPPPSITVTSPNGGEAWAAGSTQTISWTYTGSPGASLRLELLKGGVLNRTIISSRSIGSSGTGSYPWRIPATQAAGTDYQIRVTSTSIPACTDTSDNNFTITGPTITVSVPNGAETWAAGTTQTITWSYTGNPGASVKIELLKGGVLNRTIISSRSIGSGGTGSYPWPIPATQAAGTDYQIRVTSTSTPACTDTSNNNFTIN